MSKQKKLKGAVGNALVDVEDKHWKITEILPTRIYFLEGRVKGVKTSKAIFQLFNGLNWITYDTGGCMHGYTEKEAVNG